MSKLKLGQAVVSTWLQNATGVVVYRADTGERLPALDAHPDAEYYLSTATDEDDFIVLLDEAQAGDAVGLAGQLAYGFDDDTDFEAI